MGFGGALDWALAVIFIGVAVLLLSGHGDFLLVGTKGKDKSQVKKKYEIRKLSIVTGIMSGILGMIELFIGFFGNKMHFLVYAYVPMIIVVFVAGFMVVSKKCKKKRICKQKHAENRNKISKDWFMIFCRPHHFPVQ
ncbi:MAG: DUF3784 domain-containing protein [Lachnospiraceae bacterium]|nr:DUF3784 domain-containing protein [Lachnospiraceae bacterium]